MRTLLTNRMYAFIPQILVLISGCSRHIEAFSHALQMDENYFDHNTEVSSPGSPGTPTPASSRIRKVTALSDFAPVNLKVERSAHLIYHAPFVQTSDPGLLRKSAKAERQE